MQPTFIFGAALLVIVAAVSLVYLTITYRQLKITHEELKKLEKQAAFHFDMLSQVGNILLDKAGVRTESGRPVRMHSHVSFVSGALRKEGDVVFNINEKGEISHTVPICIKTQDNESFMPSLVQDIKKARRKRNG